MELRFRPALARRVGWRRAAAGLVAAATLASGSAMVGGAPLASASTPTVHLTYALWDPVQEVGYKKSIAVFEKSHPNISVTVELVPYQDYEAKINAEFRAGDAPDVFWVNTPWLATWEQDGVMENLAPLIAKNHVDMSMYRPALVALHSHNGAIYGLPKDWDTEGIFYNKNYFAAHHISIPTNLSWNPTNGGNFLTLLKEATTDSNGDNALSPNFNANSVSTYGIAIINQPDTGYGGLLGGDGVYVWSQASGPFGGRCSCYPKSIAFDTPAGIQSFQFLVNLENKWHVAAPASEFGANGTAPSNQDWSLFTEGKVAMDLTGDWALSTFYGAAKFKFGVLPIPAGPKGGFSFTNGLIDAINSKSPNQAADWELEQWLGSPQSETIMGSGGYIWPGIASLDHLFLQAWAKRGVDVGAFLKEAEDPSHLETLPVAYGGFPSITTISDDLGPMWLGSEPVASAVAKAAKDGDADLAMTG
ncbi:MAG TPA: sugar ABC transporter substrate-binding protein [Acidimicrobiales bacterium]|nr:sugar ABC transporter substrate-binding protein [Acidimicrobiales bacterium]